MNRWRELSPVEVKDVLSRPFPARAIMAFEKVASSYQCTPLPWVGREKGARLSRKEWLCTSVCIGILQDQFFWQGYAVAMRFGLSRGMHGTMLVSWRRLSETQRKAWREMGGQQLGLFVDAIA